MPTAATPTRSTRSTRPSSLGTADAKIYLHAGLIEIANGLTDQGKAHLQQALALNPTVSPTRR